MPKFFCDMLDVLRLRFKPLSSYVYPSWQPLAWLVLIGVIGGVDAQVFKTGVIERIAFFVTLNLAEALLLSVWLMVWWRYVLNRPVQGSLFPLVTLATSVQLLELFTRLLPDDIALYAAVSLAFYGVFVLMSSVAAALNEKRGTVLLALLAYLPAAMGLFQIAMGMALKWSWIDLSTLPAQ